MVRLARMGMYDEDTHAFVTRIVPGNLGGAGIVAAIDSFLRRTFVYRDERDEVLREVSFMLNDYATLGHMEGDCDDMAIMSAAMSCTCGLSTRYTAIKSANPYEFDHVFTESFVNANWVPIDPTVPQGTIYSQYGYMSEVVC